MDKIKEESCRLIKEADEREAQWTILKTPQLLMKCTCALALLAMPLLICENIHQVYDILGEGFLYYLASILALWFLAFRHINKADKFKKKENQQKHIRNNYEKQLHSTTD